MKVFFIGTPRGDLNLGRKIYDFIESEGCVHVTNFMKEVSIDSFYGGESKIKKNVWKKRYLARMKEIASADVCVLEISYPSLGMGQILQECIRQEKPVIALYRVDNNWDNKPYFVQGIEDNESRVLLREYLEEEVFDILRDALIELKELLTIRFTMLMPADLNKYLSKINEKRGVSKSEFIRELIRKEMINKEDK